MVKRSAPKDEPDPTRSVRDEFYPKGRKRGFLVRIQVDFTRTGKLLRYSLVLIDTHLPGTDHGRVMGYDNAHGYHHRHYLGIVEPVEFKSYEDILYRFEAEYRQYLDEHQVPAIGEAARRR